MNFKKQSSHLSAEQIELLCMHDALNTMGMGRWSWDNQGPVLWDEQMHRLFNLKQTHTTPSVNDILHCIQLQHHAAILDALDESQSNRERFDQVIELEPISKQPARRLRMVGQWHFSSKDQQPILIGICREEPKETALAGTRTESKPDSNFMSFFNLTDELLAEFDFEGRFVEFNHAWTKLTGYSSEYLKGRSILDFVHPDDLSIMRGWLQRIREAASNPANTSSSSESSESRIRSQDNQYFSINWNWTLDLQQNRLLAIARDTTAIKLQSEHLTSTLEQARRSNVELASFASTASHDLREPLRMITSYLGLLRERYPEALDARGRRYVDYAYEGADRMRTLIEDLLTYSRLGQASKDYQAIAIDEVMAQAIDNLAILIQRTKAEITVDIDHAPVVWGDKTRLTQLFQNLLTNAVKFQAEDQIPRIKVRFYDGQKFGQNDKWVVRVSDNGIGIDPDHADLLFKLFQRLNTRDEYDGSGIGLAICKKIAEQHTGRIWFTSTPGAGSSFYVSLPKADAHQLY